MLVLGSGLPLPRVLFFAALVFAALGEGCSAFDFDRPSAPAEKEEQRISHEQGDAGADRASRTSDEGKDSGEPPPSSSDNGSTQAASSELGDSGGPATSICARPGSMVTGQSSTAEAGTEPSSVQEMDSGVAFPPDASGPGAAGSAGPVTGQLIDFWGAPLPNIAVTIGEQTATTDSQGRFEIDDVASEYDVSFILYAVAKDHGWRFEGLTRRDPTLQVFNGREERSREITISLNDTEYPSNMRLGIGVGSPNGSNTTVLVSNGTAFEDDFLLYWYGDKSALATYHTLLWEETDRVPTKYVGYDSAPIALSTDLAGQTFSTNATTDQDLSTFTVDGEVIPRTGRYRSNQAYVRFTDGSSVKLATVDDADDEFSYLVPALPESSVTVAAYEFESGFEPVQRRSMAMAYQGGLTQGADPVSLTIPALPKLLSPIGTTPLPIDDVSFRWQGVDGPIMIRIEGCQDCGGPNAREGFYIVTSKKDVPFSKFGDESLALHPGLKYNWQVQYHGDFGSVDDMTGAGGFISPFDMDLEQVLGPREGSGVYAQTTYPGFTTAD